jgi:hypothetical protein
MALEPKRRKPKSDQSARFIAAAKLAEADESGKKFELAMKKVVKAAPKRVSKR